MYPGEFTESQKSMFNKLDKEEKKKYIGCESVNITDNNVRKKMCVNYKNLQVVCASKQLTHNVYYSKPAKLVSWYWFSRLEIRRMPPSDALTELRKYAVCLKCAATYYTSKEYFFDIDLRTIICGICKFTKSNYSNTPIPICEKCYKQYTKNVNSILQTLLKPVTFMFQSLQFNINNDNIISINNNNNISYIRLFLVSNKDADIEWSSKQNMFQVAINLKENYQDISFWERLIILRHWIIWFVLEQQPIKLILWGLHHNDTGPATSFRTHQSPQGMSKWYYCLEPTEVDDSERLNNNRFLINCANQIDVNKWLYN